MNKDNKTISFQLNSISSNQFAVIDEMYIHDETPRLDASFSFAFEVERRLLTCRAKFSFFGSKGVFMIIEDSCHFDIQQSSWDKMFDYDQKILIVDKLFASHITSLTIGTVRGILFAKTEQTVFNLIYIPIMHVDEYFQNDLVLSNQIFK